MKKYHKKRRVAITRELGDKMDDGFIGLMLDGKGSI
jgi:hypothetical protein